MNHKNSLLFPLCLLAGLVPLLALPLTGKAQALYDASLGTLPPVQGWTFGELGPVTDTLVSNSVLLDTTATTSTEAGWSEIPADLNRAKGFSLLFNLQLNAEAHTSTNRAGFSIIVLGDDKLGIELGFWTNTVFAQSDSPLFTQAESASLPATPAFVNYSLNLSATNYVLKANGTAILSGPVRNYTAFSGFPNPYSTPDLVFMGDDTSSAAASVNIRSVTLITAPTLAMRTPGVLSWSGVGSQTYQVQTSSNLVNWSSAGTSTSQTSAFQFTNNPAQPGFFRVVFP